MMLEDLGWNAHFAQAYEPHAAENRFPARITQEHTHLYRLVGTNEETLAHVTGRFRHDAERPEDFPAVGDWVVASKAPQDDRASIHAVLPRKCAFVRKTAGALTEAQVVAANVDMVFLVSGLDNDFNLRRIERYLTLAWDSGARPILVLNKADVCPDVAARIEETEAVACGAPIYPVSGTTGQGVDALRGCLAQGKTAAFLGSSGVGKSTLINRFLGYERQATRGIREDDSRGRHTTTARELIVLPDGGVVVDTPGMRELQLWGDEHAVDTTFRDVAALGESCRFRDCTHHNEPGCAVQAAMESGALPEDRYQSYVKLQRELAFTTRRHDERAQLEYKRERRRFSKAIRHDQKLRGNK